MRGAQFHPGDEPGSVGAAPPGLDDLHVLGPYWHDDPPARTELGELVRRARDGQDPSAANELARRVVRQVAPALGAPLDGDVMVVGVPSNPVREVEVSTVVARALAEAGVGKFAADVIERRNRGRNSREVEPALRSELAERAGFRCGALDPGTTVVLVDDVVLTGTTLSHLAALLRAAGAASVLGVVVARTRRAEPA